MALARWRLVGVEQPEAVMSARTERSAVIQRARELVDYARHQGYRVDELIKIIQSI
jgi:hypothetical protein